MRRLNIKILSILMTTYKELLYICLRICNTLQPTLKIIYSKKELFKTKADSSTGVFEEFRAFIFNVSVVPILRLKRLATFFGSFSENVLACSPTIIRSLRKPTTDGSVSLNPFGFLNTSTVPFVNLAIRELVVPKSIPNFISLFMIFIP